MIEHSRLRISLPGTLLPVSSLFLGFTRLYRPGNGLGANTKKQKLLVVAQRREGNMGKNKTVSHTRSEGPGKIERPPSFYIAS